MTRAVTDRVVAFAGGNHHAGMRFLKWRRDDADAPHAAVLRNFSDCTSFPRNLNRGVVSHACFDREWRLVIFAIQDN